MSDEVDALLSLLSAEVRKLAWVEPNFPEAYCDLTCVFLFEYLFLQGVEARIYQCGVEGRYHYFLEILTPIGELVVDFTAHQFSSLQEYTEETYGAPLLVERLSEIVHLGYTEIRLLEYDEVRDLQRSVEKELVRILARYRKKISRVVLVGN